MPRLKKDYRILNIKLDSEINNRFEIYCNEMGQTKTTAIERILLKHLDEHDERKKDKAKKE